MGRARFASAPADDPSRRRPRRRRLPTTCAHRLGRYSRPMTGADFLLVDRLASAAPGRAAEERSPGRVVHRQARVRSAGVVGEGRGGSSRPAEARATCCCWCKSALELENRANIGSAGISRSARLRRQRARRRHARRVRSLGAEVDGSVLSCEGSSSRGSCIGGTAGGTK